MTSQSHAKFDPDRAAEYAQQARIGLAGYDACHELSACILSAALAESGKARILVVGAGGTAGEIVTAATLEPTWTFTAVDPSKPMLDLARSQVEAAGIGDRVTFVDGDLSSLPTDRAFDGAIMIGVLHHIPEDGDKVRLLKETAARLKPDGSLILAGNYRHYASEPLLQAAWANRWRMFGADEDEVDKKLAKIQAGAAPPASEAVVAELLAQAEFAAPQRFFSSLFWGAWYTRLSG